jgi:hypothetical protein
MSHFAELNENNVVLRVLVGNDLDPKGDEGYSWIVENLGGRWVQTSYNRSIRKNFAGIGSIYDEERDAFIPPKPSDNAVLDEETCTWIMPSDTPSEITE